MAREIRVPQLLDGHADEDEEESNADDPSHDEATNRPGHLLEVRHMENAVVHEQQTDLGPTKVPGVEDFGHQQPLCHHDNPRRLNLVSMEAHAIVVHGKDEANNNEIPSLSKFCDFSYFGSVWRQSLSGETSLVD